MTELNKLNFHLLTTLGLSHDSAEIVMDRISELESEVSLRRQEVSAIKHSVVATVLGIVEGRPTSEINYLQRLRELVRIEADYAEVQLQLGKARAVCSHEWEKVDDSFDHEYGTEVIRYLRCEHCGKTAKWDDVEHEDARDDHTD